MQGQETGWLSNVQSCIMPGVFYALHLVQELDVGTVVVSPLYCQYKLYEYHFILQFTHIVIYWDRAHGSFFSFP